MGNYELDNKAITRFNSLYNKGFELLNGKVAMNENYYKSLNLFEKFTVKKAIGIFKECLSIHPFSWQSHWAIGKAYQALGEDYNALEHFEKACEIEQSNVSISREATLQCLSLGLKEKALKYAQMAMDANPKDNGLYSNYALSLLINKKGEEALAVINKALEIDSDDTININVSNFINSILEGKKPYPEKIGPRG